jgi:hypothetical protein
MAISTSEIATRLFKKVLGLGETSSSGKEFYEESFNGPLVSYNTNVWTDLDKIPLNLSGTTNIINLPIGSYVDPNGITGSTKNDSVLQISAWTLSLVPGTSSGTEGYAFVNTNAVDIIPFNYGSIFSYDTNSSITYNNGSANLAFGSNGSIFDPQSGILKFYDLMPSNWDGSSPFVLKGAQYVGNKLSSYDLDSFNGNISDFTGFTSSFNAYSAYTQNIIDYNYSQFTGFTNSFNSYSANTENILNTKYDKSGGTITGDVIISSGLTVNGDIRGVSMLLTGTGVSSSTNIIDVVNSNLETLLNIKSDGTINIGNQSTFNSKINLNAYDTNLGSNGWSTLWFYGNAASDLSFNRITGNTIPLDNPTILASRRWIVSRKDTETGSNTGSNLHLLSRSDSGGTLRTNLYINRSTGYMGIGSTSPTSKVHIVGAGSTSSTTGLRVDASNLFPSLVVLDNGSVGLGLTNPLARLHINGTSGIPALIVSTTGDSNSLVVSSNGNVGIGTTTPTVKLDVNGDARFRSNIYDSLNTSGLTGQALFVTPIGVQWSSVDSVITGYTNNYVKTIDFSVYSSSTLTVIDSKYDKIGGTISGDVTILGNLIVNGTATTINTQNLVVYDPIIGLALSQSGSTSPTLDSGFIIDRGVSGNTAFIWIESNRQYELGYTDNTYNDSNVTINQYGDLKLNKLKSKYLYDSLNLSGNTGDILIPTISGDEWRSVDNVISGSTSITSKLNIIDFNSYSANTENILNTKYDKSGGTITGDVTILGNLYTIGGISGGTISAAGSDGQIQFNKSGILGANSNFYWNDTQNTLRIRRAIRLGNNDTTPYGQSSAIFISGEPDYVTSGLTYEPFIHMQIYGGKSVLRVWRANGTSSSPTQTLAGDDIFAIQGGGYTSTGSFTSNNQYIIKATDNIDTGTVNVAHIFNTSSQTSQQALMVNRHGTTIGRGSAVTYNRTQRGTLEVLSSFYSIPSLFVEGSGASSSTYTAQFHNSTGTSNSLVIRDDGNIGIGTNAPETSLHVNGKILAYGEYTIYGINQALNGVGYIGVGSSNNNVNMTTGQIAGAVEFQGYRNGALGTLSRITATYQGDGTTRSSELMIAVGNSSGVMSPRLYLRNTYSQITNTDFIIATAAKAYGFTSPAKIYVEGQGTTSSTYTAQFHNSTGLSNSLVIRDDGFIGIGTANPSDNLKIEGNISWVGLGLKNLSTTGRGNIYAQNDTNKGGYIQAYGSSYIGTLAGISSANSVSFMGGGSPSYVFFGMSGLAGSIHFGYGTASSPTMTISTDNYLGIGTITPTNKVTIETSADDDGLIITRNAEQRIVLAMNSNGGFMNLYDNTNTNTAKIRSYSVSGVQAYFNAGNVIIGDIYGTSRLHVKGSGSTSSTYSFWTGNSSGTRTFSIDDAGNIYVLGLITGGTIGAAGSDGQIQYNNGGVLGANINFKWDNTNGKMIIGDYSTSPFTGYSGALQVFETTNTPVAHIISHGGNSRAGFFLGRRFKGTISSPTQVLINDQVAVFGTGAHNGTGFSSIGQMVYVAAENITPTNNGGHLDFYSIAIGTSAAAQVWSMRLSSESNLYLGNPSSNSLSTTRFGVSGRGTTSSTYSIYATDSTASTRTFSIDDSGMGYVSGGFHSPAKLIQVYGSVYDTSANSAFAIGNSGLGMSSGAYRGFYDRRNVAASTGGTYSSLEIYPTVTNSSGNTNINGILINTVYNASGTYSGFIRGFYYAPTVTSIASGTHRAIQTDIGDVLFLNGNLGVGTIPTELVSITKSQNSGTILNIWNANTGTAAYAGIRAGTAGNGISFNNYNSTYTTIASWANSGVISTDSGVANGIVFNTTHASAPIRFMNVYTEYARFTPSGSLGIGTTTPRGILDVYGSSIYLGVGASTVQLNNGRIRSSASAFQILGIQDGGSTLPINFGFVNDSSPSMSINTNSNIIIGGSTASARLHVIGGGATSATTNLLLQNSSLATLFSVRDDGLIIIPGTTTLQGLTNFGLVQFYPVNDGGYTTSNAGRELRAEITISSTVSGNFGFQWGTFSLEQSTSAASNLSMHRFTGSASPSSGIKGYSVMELGGTWNTTGTYSGIVRGLYYNPTLTSLTGATHRAIETTSGNVIFNGGNVGIGIGTAIPLSLLHIESVSNPTFTISSAQASILAGDTAGTIGFYTQDTSGIVNRYVAGIKAIAEQDYAGATAPTGLAFFTQTFNGSGVAMSEKMRITQAGSVGIGTTTPSVKLDVNGDVRFRTNIYDSLNTSGSTGQALFVTPTGVKWDNVDSVITGYTTNYVTTINFNSYSANTQNVINSNYSQFTGFTNSFNSYSAQTDTRLLFSSSTLGSTFRVNNNNDVSGSYGTISGGRYNTVSGYNSFIGGGQRNSIIGDYSGILSGENNIVLGNNTFIIGSNITGNTSNTTYVENLSINGSSQTSALFTTTNTTLNSGLNVIYPIPTIYDGAFIDYTVKMGNSARSGQLMSIWSGSSINYTETTTVDIGDTTPVSISMMMSGSTPVFISSATTSGWIIKSIIRAI